MVHWRHKNSPPGGWDHYNAEHYFDDRDKERHEENKKVKGKWMVVRYTARGPTSRFGKPMSYAAAIREAKERNESEFKMGLDGLGKFMGSFKVEKWKSRTKKG